MSVLGLRALFVISGLLWILGVGIQGIGLRISALGLRAANRFLPVPSSGLL